MRAKQLSIIIPALNRYMFHSVPSRCLSCFTKPVLSIFSLVSLFVPYRITCWAVSPFSLPYNFERMTVYAMCFFCVVCGYSIASMTICFCRNKFKMIRVAARSVFAEVINLLFHSCLFTWDWFNKKCVQQSMHALLSSVVETLPVSSTIFCSCPVPTSCARIYLNFIEQSCVFFSRKVYDEIIGRSHTVIISFRNITWQELLN